MKTCDRRPRIGRRRHASSHEPEDKPLTPALSPRTPVIIRRCARSHLRCFAGVSDVSALRRKQARKNPKCAARTRPGKLLSKDWSPFMRKRIAVSIVEHDPPTCKALFRLLQKALWMNRPAGLTSRSALPVGSWNGGRGAARRLN